MNQFGLVQLPEQGGEPYRVMIVDDSAFIRGAIARALENDPLLRIVFSLGNGEMAIRTLRQEPVDVIVLDIEMPVMDGLTALPQLKLIDPAVQIIIASTLTQQNAEISLRAMSLGATDYIPKPTTSHELMGAEDFKRELIEKIKTLGQIARRSGVRLSSSSASGTAETPTAAPTKPITPPRPPADKTPPSREIKASLPQEVPVERPRRGLELPPVPAAPKTEPNRRELPPAAAQPAQPRRENVEQATAPPRRAPVPIPSGPKEIVLRKAPILRPDVIAIGSSTGGPQALFKVVREMGGLPQPVVITQHMPPSFTAILADHISKQCQVDCVEAKNGDVLSPRRYYIAPGDFHMLIEAHGGAPTIKLTQDPPESFCRPAVDPMLRSLVKVYGNRILTVILTGMGQDGLRGSESVVSAGGAVVAQDEATSVVWGMPGAVAMAGLCTTVLPIETIGEFVRQSALGPRA